MKSKITFITLLMTISIGLLGFTFFQLPIGPHQGTVQNAGALYCIEFKNNNQEIRTYLLDKKFNSIGNKGIVCQIKFIFADSTSYTKMLKPFGNEGFSTGIIAPSFCSCRIFFNISGKTVSAKFENPNLLVQKK